MSAPDSRSSRQPSWTRITLLAIAVAVAAAPWLLRGAVIGSVHAHGARQQARAAFAIVAPRSVRQSLIEGLKKAPGASPSLRDGVPVIALRGTVAMAAAAAQAGTPAPVMIYGVDERFWTFFGLPGAAPREQQVVSGETVAARLGAADGSSVRVSLPSSDDALAAALHGRRSAGQRTFDGQLVVSGAADLAQLSPLGSPLPGELAGAIFVPLARLEDDPGRRGRANAILVASASDDPAVQAPALDAALAAEATLDDYRLSLREDDNARAVVVESQTGAMDDAVTDAIARAALDTGGLPTPVLTTLVGRLRNGEREVPYSFVSSLELQAVAPDVHAEELSRPPVVLNEWTATRLAARPGDTIGMEYFVVGPEGAIVSEAGEFEVAGILPMSGLALQPGLTPTLPGITGASAMRAWAPGVPFDTNRIGAGDEEYWSRHATTPKAFVPPQVGRALWRTGVRAATSVQVTPADGVSLASTRAQLEARLRERLLPAMFGIHVRPLVLDTRVRAAAAGEQVTAVAWWVLPVVLAALLASTVAADPWARPHAQEAASAIAAGLLLALPVTGLLAAASAPVTILADGMRTGAAVPVLMALGVALAVGAGGFVLWRVVAPVLSSRQATTAAGLLALVAIALAIYAARGDAASAGSGHAAATVGDQLFARTTLPVPDVSVLSDGVGQVTAFRVHEAAGPDSEITTSHPDVRLVSVPRAFIDQARFTFSASLDRTDEERANPWLLLRREQRDASAPDADGAGSPIVPAVATPAMLSRLQRALGDDIPLAIDGRPLRLRVVAVLHAGAGRDAWGEALFVADADFSAWLPMTSGWRWFAIHGADASRSRSVVVERLTPWGAEVEDDVELDVDDAEGVAAHGVSTSRWLSAPAALAYVALLLALASVPLARSRAAR